MTVGTSAAAETLHGRVHASIAGALAAEQACGAACGAGPLLAVAESLALHDSINVDDLRSRGLASPPTPLSAALLRGVPFGLLAPTDRTLMRRGAHRVAGLGGADDATAIACVAVTILCGDLSRHDLPTSLMRVRQTLLEEAPTAVLAALRPLPSEASWELDDTQPLAALQLAITGLGQAAGVRGVIDAMRTRSTRLTVSVALAAALAGARDRDRGLHEEWFEDLPNSGRTGTAASGLAKRAGARVTSAAAGTLAPPPAPVVMAPPAPVVYVSAPEPEPALVPAPASQPAPVLEPAAEPGVTAAQEPAPAAATVAPDTGSTPPDESPGGAPDPA